MKTPTLQKTPYFFLASLSNILSTFDIALSCSPFLSGWSASSLGAQLVNGEPGADAAGATRQMYARVECGGAHHG